MYGIIINGMIKSTAVVKREKGTWNFHKNQDLQVAKDILIKSNQSSKTRAITPELFTKNQ